MSPRSVVYCCLPGTKRSATVKAKTFTALARLSAEHFDEVLVRFPHELRNAFRGFDLMAGEVSRPGNRFATGKVLMKIKFACRANIQD